MRALNLLGILLLGFAAQATPAATLVGSIAGKSSVSDTGAATYTVPIAVPPGTAGMEPKLALTYSSQGGNGVAGMGWSISGLSAITRCPQTIAQDNATRGVQLDANDRFCLDGQRLILLNGSTYGAVGAEYRTEIESFSKVLSYGGTPSNPQYFKVWTKAGQIIEYGNTTDSRFAWQVNGTALSWAANKISDTVGNYFTFTYSLDTANGEQHVTRIDYTGNTAAGLSPYDSVQFAYEARPDVDIGYIKGSKTQSSLRLLTVSTYNGATLVRTYSLSYETGSTTGKSRLTSVTECAGNGDCLPATNFFWQEGTAGLDTTGVNTGIPNTNPLYSFGVDVDGDGITDLVYPSGTTWKVRFGGPAGFSAEVDTAIANTGYQYARPIDFNADGKMDLLVPYANNHWYLLKATGDQNNPFVAPADTGISDVSKYYNPQIADMNGDGLPDLVLNDGSYWGVAYSTGTGLGTAGAATYSGVNIEQQPPWAPGTLWQYWQFYTRIGDIDGDGLPDVIAPFMRYYADCSACSYGFWYYWTRTRSGTFIGDDVEQTSQGYTQYTHSLNANVFTVQDSVQIFRNEQTGDVNGDGISDLLVMGPDPNNNSQMVWWLCLFTGSRPICQSTGFTATGAQSFREIDYNADGLVDYIVGPYANSHFYIFKSNRTGFSLIDSGIPDAGYDQNPIVGDFNGDGLTDVLLSHDGSWHLHTHLGAQPDLLLSVTNGLGATTTFTYKPLTDAGVYTKGTGAMYPDKDLAAPLYVVANVSSDNGAGSSFSETHSYIGARVNQNGRGLLGFASHHVHDDVTGRQTETDFINQTQNFPYIGLPVEVRSYAGGTLVSQVDNTYVDKLPNSGKTHFPYVSESIEKTYDLNGGSQIAQATTDNIFDDYGNATQVTVTSSDIPSTGNWVKTTVNSYLTPDPANWILGRLSNAKVTSTLPNGTNAYRVSSFGYDPTTHLLNSEVIEPDTGREQYNLVTAYNLDAYGNRYKTTVSSAAAAPYNIAPRTTEVDYVYGTDITGRFPLHTINALGHTEDRTYDPGLGVMKTLTGPNGLVTQWQYDGFGRQTLETRADTTTTSTSYQSCAGDVNAPAYCAYAVSTTELGSPTRVIYYDKLGRATRSAVVGFNGTWVYKDTQYDSAGRVWKVSRPYYAGDTAYWTETLYDALGRVGQINQPDAGAPGGYAITQIAYNGLSTTVTDANHHATTKLKNSQGQLVSVTDAKNGQTTYTYDPFGNLTQTTALGVVTQMSYDIRGHKISMTDPDMGNWSYVVNPLGQLVKQTDAKNQSVTMQYDLLGRMTSRSEPDLNSTWNWDTDDGTPTGTPCGPSIGKLCAVGSDNGVSRNVTYDQYGRPSSGFTSIDATYMSGTTYDAYGRVDTAYTVNPQGKGATIQRGYNAYGYLNKLTRLSDNKVLWTAQLRDADGRIAQSKFGNGVTEYRTYYDDTGRMYAVSDIGGPAGRFLAQSYVYDGVGNLQTRSDDVAGVDSTYTYDELDRMQSYQKGADLPQNYGYDATGNLTANGANTLLYGKSSCPYVTSPIGPHAVCITATTGNYRYDANGNLVRGGGRTLSYTSYNQPYQITDSSGTTTFIHDADHQRVQQTRPDGSYDIYVTPLPGLGLPLEKAYTPASGSNPAATDYKTALLTPDGPVGQSVTHVSNGATTTLTRYWHTDYQGSIWAITDASAAVIASYSYGPWGGRTVVADSTATRRGYTGQEHLDDGLIHMNGRIFDPVISRFLQADPYVQAPDDGQSYNRYSYVMNNPMRYTDPTGFSAWTDFRDGFLKPVVGIAVAVWAPEIIGELTGLGATASNIAAGAISGGITGGGRGALMGAVSAGMFSGLHGMDPGFGKIIAHGVAGGLMSEMQGGSFQSGFLAGSFTQGVSELGWFNNLGDPNTWGGRTANAIGAAVVGGTASVIGGGKFANGAMTGAFSRLFNDISIEVDRDTYTRNSVTGRLTVASDRVSTTFSGYTLEDAHAGPNGDKSPIPSGEYPAFVRTDHTPNRVELMDVDGYSNIQMHIGNTVDDVMGCFAVGATRSTDFVGGSRTAMDRILNIIRQDGTGRITVKIVGPSTAR